MKFLFCFLLVGVLIACQERSTSTHTEATADTARTQCYGYTDGQSRVNLRLNPTEGDSVRGELTYALAGKDRNTGTVAGWMRGDTLVGAYMFQSEGAQSVREVVFLFGSDGVREAVGPVAERKGRMEFTDRRALRFDQLPVLRPEPCASE